MTRIKSSEITPEHVYHSRRHFLKSSMAGAGLATLSSSVVQAAVSISNVRKSGYKVDGDLTSYDDATSYNNFYEFGTDKGDPKKRSGNFKPDPWHIEIAGEVKKPGKIAIEQLLKPHALEERIYRFRCVEAWSMVIPWIGIPLRDVLKRLEPTSSAKYVAFETVVRPEQMPGQRSAFGLDWPYVEGLRLDEAMNPLTLLAVGMYGKALPNQNGAPIRLVVPWKYGFKSIKSIVKISLTKTQPPTTWNLKAPKEYGFYSNVNPKVDHPRWSQRSERPIGGFFRKPTLMFNGYQEEVASLYHGMDLAVHF